MQSKADHYWEWEEKEEEEERKKPAQGTHEEEVEELFMSANLLPVNRLVHAVVRSFCFSQILRLSTA